MSGQEKSGPGDWMRIGWVLFLGGAALYKLFGLGEPETVVYNGVTAMYEDDDHAEVAAKIAKVMATDRLISDPGQQFDVQVAEENGGYKLDIFLRPGHHFAVASHQRCARLLMDNATDGVPVSMQLNELDGDYISDVQACPPVGKRLTRKTDNLFYLGDISEEEASTFADGLERIQWFENKNNTAQVEKRTDGTIVLRLEFATPLHKDKAKELKQTFLANFESFMTPFGDRDVRIECTNEAFSQLGDLAWETASHERVIVGFDTSVTRQVAMSIAKQAIQPDENQRRLIRVLKSETGVECLVNGVPGSEGSFDFWGKLILNELPEEVEQITVRCLDADDKEIEVKTVTERIGDTVRVFDGRLFVAVPDASEELVDALVDELTTVGFYGEGKSSLLRLTHDADRYELQVAMLREDAEDTDIESLEEVGQSLFSECFEGSGLRIRTTDLGFSPVNDVFWESTVSE